VGLRCRKLHTDTQPSAYLTSDNGLKDRVRVKFNDGGEGTGGGVVPGIEVTDMEEDGLEFRGGVF
jgi:hypothetical protein